MVLCFLSTVLRFLLAADDDDDDAEKKPEASATVRRIAVVVHHPNGRRWMERCDFLLESSVFRSG